MPGEKTIKRVAVLGGGAGSLSTVFELLKATKDDPSVEYQITVYQLGWRLGGKGASGRDDKYFERIEEHGLHIWFGMYNNAFNQIKAVYDELKRPAGMPLATWQEAFTPENWVAAEESHTGQWITASVPLPINDLEPGGQHVFLKPIEYLEDILSLVLERMVKTDFFQKEVLNGPHKVKIHADKDSKDTSMEEVMQWILGKIEGGLHVIQNSSFLRAIFLDALRALRAHLKELIGDIGIRPQDTRCAYIFCDLGITVGIGFLEDKVMENGFDVINKYDLREWLNLHGADPEATKSAFLRGAYDALFAFENGDPSRPSIEAGTSLKCAMLAFGNRGSVFYKMNAGMGDAIFAPIYELLKKYGVKFEFFSRVKNLGLSADKKQVASIQIGRQVRLKDGLNEYNPLKTVKNLPSWPRRPLYDQLNPDDAKALQDNDINLESHWVNWQDREEITLNLGTDFDQVVFGLSLGPVAYTCKELLAEDQNMVKMLANVQTVQTQALQLWSNESIKDLGWEHHAKVLGAYVEPLDTWSEMNQVLDRENWPPDYNVQSISYFCGVLKGGPELPPPGDHHFPQQMRDSVIAQSKAFLQNNIAVLWPNGVQSDGTLDWNKLVATPGKVGEARLMEQYFRANIDPSERYVQTVKGSSQYRMKTNGTKFSNLFLAGDWIDNGMNVGAVEAAIISGMLCASAISGKEIPVVGGEILHSTTVPQPAPTGLYDDLKKQARAIVEAVKDSPQGRLDLRKKFYEKYGGDVILNHKLGYGDAEISFMEWEIKRGVLNPLNGPKPGSPWWYNVNLEFLYWGELSQLVYESGFVFSNLDTQVNHWLLYIRKPGPATWYRAHNTSIASGYISFKDLAWKETVFERIFMNEVLYRVLYVGTLQMGPISKLPLRGVQNFFFDPALGIFNILEDIPEFYPQNYPLSEKDILNVLYQGKSIAGEASTLLNKLFILSHLNKVYSLSAQWLNLPEIKTFADGDNAIYPDKVSPQPKVKGFVKGTVQSLIVSSSLDASVVASLLPPELELSAQSISPAGQHPFLVFFNHNRLHATFFPWINFPYNELAFLIPYVNFKGQSETYAFTPILYVDSRIVSWLGEYMWKFNKLYANFNINPAIEKGWKWFLDSNQVNYQALQSSQVITSANSSNVGQPCMLNDLSGISGLKDMLSLPGLMGREGKFAKVGISMDYETAEVYPASGAVQINELQGFPLKNVNIPFSALGGSPFGGFRANWDITLSSPFGGDKLKHK